MFSFHLGGSFANTNHRSKAMNTNQPQTEILPVDPAWEYCTVYGQLLDEKAELEAILAWMSNIEHPEKKDDFELRMKLLNLIAKMRVTAHNL